jgi:hypothetical protein
MLYNLQEAYSAAHKRIPYLRSSERVTKPDKEVMTVQLPNPK